MRYQIENGTVSLGGKTILNHIDFSIKGQEKIAVVGCNGAGKTTLLRLIGGELSLDRDDKRFGRKIPTGSAANHRGAEPEGLYRAVWCTAADAEPAVFL